MPPQNQAKEYEISVYKPETEPFYMPVADEVDLFRIAHDEQMAVLLKGPTGCGKTRLVEYMSYLLNKEMVHVKKKEGEEKTSPLVSVACHEDLTADDLKGRHLIDGTYLDGAALIAVKNDGILYLDEIVEARPDTTVVIHPLADHRRTLTIEKQGKVYVAPPGFMLVMSYNPGYQKKIKELKQSTRQRFIAIQMGYAPEAIEAKIVAHEAKVNEDIARTLVRYGAKVRNLKGKGLEEGASTRLLINAGKLIRRGITPIRACEVAILNPITDDLDVYEDQRAGLEEVLKSYFE